MRLSALPLLTVWMLSPLLASGSVVIAAGVAGGFAALSLVGLWLSGQARGREFGANAGPGADAAS